MNKVGALQVDEVSDLVAKCLGKSSQLLKDIEKCGLAYQGMVSMQEMSNDLGCLAKRLLDLKAKVDWSI